MAQTAIGYKQAVDAIAARTATAHALFVLLSSEHDRDGYWLKPSPWEGPGEYQRVTFEDGRSVFVRLPDHRSLPIAPLSPAVEAV